MQQAELEAVIARAIGPEEAQKAVEAVLREWGGCRERIPVPSTQRHVRDHNIRRNYQSGVTIQDLAKRYDLSERHIRRIVGQ